ncbi:YaeQ protein [mine drainage metagenome]|uniref:YaeQ protein n=1 Tax=mine drainage metagenome TaxID=410659 RepID=A0A1J5PVC0_9ZZZZ
MQAHQLQSICAGDGTLAFGAGLSDPNEPDVWLRDFPGRTRLWLEVGQPEDKPLSKACSKADAVMLYAFGPAADIWWRAIESKLSRLKSLQVWRISSASAQALIPLAQRSMALQATVQEGVLMLGDGTHNVDIEPLRWK